MGPSDQALPPARRRIAALGAAVACVVALLATSAEAAPSATDPGKEKRKVDAQVDQLKAQLDETSA
ncbi:MAG: hypothetical protein WBL35_12015, partial [Ornithinibacter sp.]